jgi:dipeptidyl aminopeptidase/acylaminoacyl peptidase
LYLAFECGNGDYPNTAQDVCVVQGVTNPVDGMADGDGKEYVTDAVDPTLGGSGAFAWNPQNPDQLAVVRDSNIVGAGFGSLIWLVNYDGSGRTPLGSRVILSGAGAPVQVVSMDWSPDGSFIALEGVSGGTSSIYRIEVTTGNVTQLTSQNVDFGPVVSPDGTEILFGRQNDLWTLMKISADGSNLVQMSDYMNFAPAEGGWDWSPDGSEVVLTEDRTTGGVTISKILRTTTVTSFFSDVTAGKVGRRGGAEIQDRQPSWRP